MTNADDVSKEPQPSSRADLDTEPSQIGESLIETLTFGLTIPERTARSVSALVGGLVHESAARLIPSAFRSSRSYTVFVQQALDMMVHDVGGVENATPRQHRNKSLSSLRKRLEAYWMSPARRRCIFRP